MPPSSWKPVKLRQEANRFLKGCPTIDQVKQSFVPCEGECRGKGSIIETEQKNGYTISHKRACKDCGGTGGQFLEIKIDHA
jgi:DnaJ-class molecular chaperone